MKKINQLLLLCFVLLASMTSFSQSKNIIKVDVESPNGGWGATAYKHLQDALAAAQEGDEIWVADGIYYPDRSNAHPDGTDERELSFTLINGISILGGFIGTETSSENRQPDINVTILSGEIGAQNYNEDNTYHILKNTVPISDVVIDGITITKSYAYSLAPFNDDKGGGCLFDNITVSFINCNFIDNYAKTSGGAIQLGENSSLSILDCTFENNKAPNSNFSGAIQLYEAIYCQIDNSDFINNKGGSGGAINFYGNENSCYAQITNCLFESNKGTYWGGGAISIWQKANTIIENCQFTNNGGYNGGAVLIMDNSNLQKTINNCYFELNSAREGGAIKNGNNLNPKNGKDYLTNPGNLEVENCRFYLNSATLYDGGAISSYFNFKSINNIFMNNTSPNNGGALNVMITGYMDGVIISEIINCTFYNNTSINGQSIAITLQSNNYVGNIKVINSILWNQTSTELQIYKNYNDIPLYVSYSCIKGGYSGGQEIVTSDPLLSDPLNEDFHLNANSPCINKGTSLVENLPEYDFEGDYRDNCTFVDIGADEFVASSCNIIYVKATGDDENSGLSWGDAMKTLQAAINEAGQNYQIWVAQGTYYPTQPISNTESEYIAFLKTLNEKDNRNYPTDFETYKSDSRNYTLYINKPLHIFGGFYGIETELDDRNWADYPTILSGELDNDNNPDNNCNRVVSLSLTNAIIDGFTIEEARPVLNGAGIYAVNTELELNNCTLSNNHVSAMYIKTHCDLSIKNCKFSYNTNNNSIYLSGSPIYIHDSEVSIKDSQFNNNISNHGGAIHSFNTICNIQHTIFNDNYANNLGGAIDMRDDSYVKIDFCTFSNNNAGEAGKSFILGDSKSTSQNRLDISNSIVWNTNRVDHISGTGVIQVKYTDLQLSINDPNITYNMDETNLNENPEFVSTNNFHLNTTGKYEYLPPFHTNNCSPCIDAGDPSILPNNEPGNSRVNMGRYGNTEEAAPACSKADKVIQASQADLLDDVFDVSPNPFANQIEMAYSSSLSVPTNIIIYNINGQTVYYKEFESVSNDNITLTWDGKNMSGEIQQNGIYLVKISNAYYSNVKKVILNKY